MKISLTLLLLLTVAETRAQIVYTNIKPDTTVACNLAPCSSFYDLDLNNDGNADYQFVVTGDTVHGTGDCLGEDTSGWTIGFTDNFSTSQIFTDADNNPSVLSLNDLIPGDSAIWRTSSYSMIYPAFICLHYATPPNWRLVSKEEGLWLSQTDKYIGLKLQLNGKSYYGWVHVNVTSSSLIVRDYAYNSVTNEPLLAGQKDISTGINSPAQNIFSVSPNPFTNSTHVIFSSDHLQPLSAKIFDVQGRLIRTLASGNTQSGTQSATWNGCDEAGHAVTPGIYFLKAQSGKAIETIPLVLMR